MDSVSVEKPVEVSRAVNCLWVSLALGFVKALTDMQHLSAQAAPVFTNFILVTVIAIGALLIYKTGQGKNWARITYLVLMVIGSLPSLPLVLAEFGRSPVLGAFSIIQIGLQVFALWLLFTNPGKVWFKSAHV